MSARGPHVVLISPGAKMGLTVALADAIGRRGGRLTAWESDRLAPAASRCTTAVDGGPIEDDPTAQRLLDWCAVHGVQLVVPTRHDDLPALSAARPKFIEAGIEIAVSDSECVDLCLNKSALHRWLGERGHPVPRQTTVGDFSASDLRTAYPLVAKDPRGSGSRQIRRVASAAELSDLPKTWLLQTCAPGVEHTVNVYLDRHGRSVCEIPHERLIVSEGEVVRGRTRRVKGLMDLARTISEELPGARGPLNVQIFWDATEARATVIEINPRFGGGYPLAERAGGRFCEWLLAEYADNSTLPRIENWEDDLTMIRYREAMFVSATRDIQGQSATKNL